MAAYALFLSAKMTKPEPDLIQPYKIVYNSKYDYWAEVLLFEKEFLSNVS